MHSYYYYVDSSGQTAGPVELTSLHHALHDGSLTPETLVVEVGGSEWKPLSALARAWETTIVEHAESGRPAELPEVSDPDDPDSRFMMAGDTEWRRPAPVRRLSPRLPVHGQPAPAATVARSAKHRPRGIPGAAKAAGILWIVFGVLKLTDCIMALDALNKVPNQLRDTALLTWLIPVLMSSVFIRAGIQTCRGTADDTHRNGLASIGLAIVAVLYAKQQSLLTASSAFTLMLLAPVIFLFVAGILAITARKSYRHWKSGNPARRR